MTQKETPKIVTSDAYPVHYCKGYVEKVEQLSLSYETIKRANSCGFNVTDFADCCLKTIKHDVKDNSYDSMAKIVDDFADVVILFLRKYKMKDIEVGRFQSSDIQEEFVVYLSETYGGYIIANNDENGRPSIRVTHGDEIWRYLGEPLHIIETLISAVVAYAEKHQSVKNEWLFTLEDIQEISRE